MTTPDPDAPKSIAIAMWVFVSGMLGYGCLAYAVFDTHADLLSTVVNRLLNGNV